MELLVWIIFGAFVGWVASMIMRTEGGLLWDIALGSIGAVVGGLIMQVFGAEGVAGLTLYSFLVALLGACIFIAVLRMVRR